MNIPAKIAFFFFFHEHRNFSSLSDECMIICFVCLFVCIFKLSFLQVGCLQIGVYLNLFWSLVFSVGGFHQMSGGPCLSADGNEWRKQLTGIECLCVCVSVCGWRGWLMSSELHFWVNWLSHLLRNFKYHYNIEFTKNHFRFSHTSLWKNPNELLCQQNAVLWLLGQITMNLVT